MAEAIRIIIMILIFVFDPLAVVMLLAANMSFKLASSQPYEKLSGQIKKKNKVKLPEENLETEKEEPPKKDITDVNILK